MGDAPRRERPAEPLTDAQFPSRSFGPLPLFLTNQRCSAVAWITLRWRLRDSSMRMSGCTPNEENGASIQRPFSVSTLTVVPTRSRISRMPSQVITRVSPARQWKTPISGLMENEGDFSEWNGQRPIIRLPTRFSARCSPASATRSVASRTLAMSSSTMPTVGAYGDDRRAARAVVAVLIPALTSPAASG